MKSIFVQNIEETQEGYSVALGDGTRHTFTNLKAARAFQVKTNNFLTTQLHNYNQVYVDLFTVYRNLWGYFYNTKNTNISNNFYNETAIKEALQTIDNLLDLASTSFSRSDNYFRVYCDFAQISESMKTICQELNNELNNKSQSITSHKINFILTQINNVSFEITKYSHSDLNHKITNDPLFQAIKFSLKTKTA